VAGNDGLIQLTKTAVKRIYTSAAYDLEQSFVWMQAIPMQTRLMQRLAK
jgi:hypothetical protein